MWGCSLLAFFMTISLSLRAQEALPYDGSEIQENFNALSEVELLASSQKVKSSLPTGWYGRTGKEGKVVKEVVETAGGMGHSGLYNWGRSGNFDRVFGFISATSAATTQTAELHLINSTDEVYDSFEVAYTGVQWRQNEEPKTLVFSYSLGGKTFVPVSELDFTSPQTGEPKGVDGVSFDFREELGPVSVAFDGGDAWKPGQKLVLRWHLPAGEESESNGVGLGLDEFFFSTQDGE